MVNKTYEEKMAIYDAIEEFLEKATAREVAQIEKILKERESASNEQRN